MRLEPPSLTTMRLEPPLPTMMSQKQWRSRIPTRAESSQSTSSYWSHSFMEGFQSIKIASGTNFPSIIYILPFFHPDLLFLRWKLSLRGDLRDIPRLPGYELDLSLTIIIILVNCILLTSEEECFDRLGTK